jgi:uncharacterized protein Usg
MVPKIPRRMDDPNATPEPAAHATLDFVKQLSGYGLTTAQIFYRFPDYPELLQFYVWQEYDVFPSFPELKRFLDFWKQSIEGSVHSVLVAHSRLVKPAEFCSVSGIFRIH